MSKTKSQSSAILVAVDFSQPSERALEQAIYLAQSLDARIDVLHVYREKPNWADQIVTPVTLGYSAKNFDILLQEAARISMEKMLKPFNKQDISLSYRITDGSPVETIVEEAHRGNYRLMVMGKKGQGNVTSALLGSIVDRVLRRSRIPVLVIPEKGKLTKKIKKILVAVDFLEASEDALRYALSMAATLHAKVTALYVSEPPLSFINANESPMAKGHLDLFATLERGNKERLENFVKPLQTNQVDLLCRVTTGEEASSITNFAQQEHADLIVMGSVGKAGIPHLILGSTAEKVLRSSSQPVLIVKLKD